MSHRLTIIFWLFTCACGLAQQQDKGLGTRLHANWDMSQHNYMDGKAYNLGNKMDFSKKTASQGAFVYDQKVSSPNYTTRSFFGLKNPWFGRKIYESGEASLWSKTLVANADRKYSVDKMKVADFAQNDKKAFLGNSITPATTYVPKSGTPGAMDQINDKLKKKKMTIDQVRDLLNKN